MGFFSFYLFSTTTRIMDSFYYFTEINITNILSFFTRLQNPNSICISRKIRKTKKTPLCQNRTTDLQNNELASQFLALPYKLGAYQEQFKNKYNKKNQYAMLLINIILLIYLFFLTLAFIIQLIKQHRKSRVIQQIHTAPQSPQEEENREKKQQITSQSRRNSTFKDLNPVTENDKVPSLVKENRRVTMNQINNQLPNPIQPTHIQEQQKYNNSAQQYELDQEKQLNTMEISQTCNHQHLKPASNFNQELDLYQNSIQEPKDESQEHDEYDENYIINFQPFHRKRIQKKTFDLNIVQEEKEENSPVKGQQQIQNQDSTIKMPRKRKRIMRNNSIIIPRKALFAKSASLQVEEVESEYTKQLKKNFLQNIDQLIIQKADRKQDFRKHQAQSKQTEQTKAENIRHQCEGSVLIKEPILITNRFLVYYAITAWLIFLNVDISLSIFGPILIQIGLLFILMQIKVQQQVLIGLGLISIFVSIFTAIYLLFFENVRQVEWLIISSSNILIDVLISFVQQKYM